MVYYLSNGNPATAKQIKNTSEKLVNDYYYQERVSDLNKMIEHIAYLEHLKEKE